MALDGQVEIQAMKQNFHEQASFNNALLSHFFEDSKSA